jgi:two-component system nitrate/nitrite response regulator NarL
MAPVSITLQPAPLRDGRPASRVSVVVADDHPLFLDGIERAVRERPELQLVGAAADGPEALARIRELAPQVALLDVRLPGLDGLQVLSALAREHAPTRVLLLSAWFDPQLVYSAVQRGAAGCFRKAADREAILDAIGAVARGRTVIDPELQAGLLDQIRDRRG